MRSLARWGTLPLMAAPVGAWGFGFGDIELQSALNQPFRAEIEITATAEELDTLEISLADQAAWDRAGLFRAGFLSSLDFELARNAAGRNVLVVTSNRSITEPFVTMLLEAEWARGRVVREYTALLDPPTMLPGPEGPVPVSTPSTGSEDRVAGGAIEREPAPAPERQAAAPAPAAPRSAPQPAAERGAADDAPGTYGPVQRGDTLWAIANEFRPADVSMNRMLVALYRANPEAFDGNMNLLRRGAILRVPGSSELSQLSASNANAEVVSQTESWQARTGAQPQPQLRLRTPAEEQAAAGPAGGETSGEPEAGGAPASGGDVASLRDEVDSLESELSESQRLIELRDQQLADLQARIAELEQSVETQAGGADAVPAGAREDAVFADEDDEDAAVVAGGPESGAAASSGGEAAAGGAEPGAGAEGESAAPAPVASAQEPSFVSRLIGWATQPFLWIGLGAVALLLAGFGYARRRRTEAEDVTGRWEALEAEIEAEEAAGSGADHEATARLRREIPRSEPDFLVEETLGGQTGSFGALEDDAPRHSAPSGGDGAAVAARRSAAAEQPARSAGLGRDEAAAYASGTDDTLSNQTVMNLDQGDPIAEADFHMAYGLYDQAADLMTKALESDPANRAYKLKLLEVYFVWGNQEQFLDLAQDLRSDVGESADADWGKVVIMGKQICPDEPMFAEAQAAAGQVDVDLDAGGSGGLDFAFGDESSSTALDEVFGEEPETDLSLESSGETEQRYSSWRDAPEDPDVLQVGATTAAGLETAFAEPDDDDDDEDGEETQAKWGAADSLEPTQESPTIEQPFGSDDEDDDWSVATMESPTIESPGFDGETTMEVPAGAAGEEDDDDEDDATRRFQPDEDTSASAMFAAPSFGEDETGESPTLDQPGESPTLEQTGESPTLEQTGESPTVEVSSGATSDVPTIEQPSAAGRSGEFTAELEIDDLGLDVSDFEDLPEGLGDTSPAPDAESDTREQPAVDLDGEDDQLLSATGVTQVLSEEDEPDFQSTSLLDDDDKTMMAPGMGGAESDSAADASGVDFDLGEMSAGLDEGGDTVEQPRAASFDSESEDVFSGSFETPVDLDVGDDVQGDDEPTDASRAPSYEPQTMTEVGTKLDLARAYIDMGDPEGARSILEEVLDEGDKGQRHEAQTLLDALSA